ncbi:glyoxal oxidase [Pterulicium gracile]|uniref:Glyoxal oxidase n=1 Tax=Pterulicium gracile TaxID=1884261 RepID=A0A5C3Q5C5_9AGAR|nr:glyoxal oxidase [Pterula gracilis]
MRKAVVLGATALASIALAADIGGTFADGGDTLVSAMMMFVGNDKKVYIIDKAQGNAAQINGHPAWGAVWDIETKQATAMDIRTNTFCASGMHLPNGSYATFGGNSAVGPGLDQKASSQDEYGNGIYDSSYENYDGRAAIRLLDPCLDDSCEWFDNPEVLSMQKRRWYSAAEPLADGTIAIIGGYVNGGFINRKYPNKDPARSGGASEPSSEFYPSRGEPVDMPFMSLTSGLNSYAHTYLMRSGKMLVQANYSTILWNPDTNEEEVLPNMPNQVIRVYPASGGVAMLPLRPTNLYNPTVLFCGGMSEMSDYDWGNFSWPFVNTWEIPSSKDCQRLTPEPLDYSLPAYEQDDDMIQGRTMGQFVTLPDGKMLMVNGGATGTAGYSTQTLLTPDYSDMPHGMSLAGEPTLKPAIYDPEAPRGQRWSDAGFGTSAIPRLYHSTAILLPDASVLIAGSNPNVDVNLTAEFPTTYQAEIFYPPYFNAEVRPEPVGVPTTYTYGGATFDVTIPGSSYSGSSNDAAASAQVNLVRPGWTTHSMTMGQRLLQLNNTYTVTADGTITLHVSQPPPMPEILQPGPVFTYVLINGVPSVGVYGIVGSGTIQTQAKLLVEELPDSVRDDTARGLVRDVDANNTPGNGGAGGDNDNSGGGMRSGVIGILAGVASAAVLLAL